jgi:hypothetical protein
MDASLPARLDGASLVDLWRRHPWWLASLGAHAVLVASLVTAGPVRIAVKRNDGVRVQVAQSLERTAQRQMRRELRAMEEIRDALAASAGAGEGEGKDGRDTAKQSNPAARARELARQIEGVQQNIRAAEMARLLHLPKVEALKRVQLDEARKPRPAPPKNASPQSQVAQLAQQAKAALAQRRAQLLAQQQGVPIKPDRQAPQRAGADVADAQVGSPQGGKPGRGLGGGKQPGQVGPGEGNGKMSGENGQGSLGGQGGQGGRAGGSGIMQQSASGGGAVEMLATGLAMGAPGAITGSSLDMSSRTFSDIRSFGAYLAPPPIDAAGVRAGGGRTIGAGGAYANRIFLDTWYVIGPFEGAGHDSQSAIYPPERGVDLDAVYIGKNDAPVRWTFQQNAQYPSVPLPRAENAVYYAWTEVTVESDMDLWVWIGGDDDTKMWFNDRLVWLSGDSVDKPWYHQGYSQLDEMHTLNLTEGQRRLHFKKGRNTVLLKLYNWIYLTFYSVVLSR